MGAGSSDGRRERILRWNTQTRSGGVPGAVSQSRSGLNIEEAEPMGRRARRAIRLPVPTLVGTMVLACVAGWAGPVRAQSELGRGAGGSVAYPFGPSGGRAGVYSNANVGARAGGASGVGM